MFARYAKKSLHFQIYGFRFLPYYYESDPEVYEGEDLKHSCTVVAWLWFQCRWYNVW